MGVTTKGQDAPTVGHSRDLDDWRIERSKRQTSFKVGKQGKWLRAGWREYYLLKVLLG